MIKLLSLSPVQNAVEATMFARWAYEVKAVARLAGPEARKRPPLPTMPAVVGLTSREQAFFGRLHKERQQRFLPSFNPR